MSTESAPQIAVERPVWRLTLVHTTPLGAHFVEIAHVELDGPEASVAARFLGPDAVAYYDEVRVEPVPRYTVPLATREPVTGINWGLSD